jgi:ribosome-binding factor A
VLLSEADLSRRTERVGNLIRQLVAETIQNRLQDPRIPTITSVTRVEVSDDFSVAHVYVSVMAAEPQRKLCVAALQKASGLFRRVLAPELSLRKIPALDFRLDDSVRQGFETVEVIDRAMRELGQVPEWELEDQETESDSDQAEDSQDNRQEGA